MKIYNMNATIKEKQKGVRIKIAITHHRIEPEAAVFAPLR